MGIGASTIYSFHYQEDWEVPYMGPTHGLDEEAKANTNIRLPFQMSNLQILKKGGGEEVCVGNEHVLLRKFN